MVEPILAAILAFAVAIVVTRAAELVSRRRGWLDVPNARSSHATPTPRIGGVGIIAGVLCGWLVSGGWQDPQGVALLAAAAALAAVGLADDLGRTSLIGKYLAQLIAAAAVALSVRPELSISVDGAGVQVDGVLAGVLTVLWLTAIINAFNFIDGIDGLLGSLTVVISIACIGFVAPDAGVGLLVVAGATLGFLAWNQAPASIFMGDVGSQFLGLWVGGLVLGLGGSAVEVVPTLIVFGLVLFDTGFTLVRRLRERKNVLTAHREHLYQRLVASGASHREVTASYAAATAVLGIVALAWPGMPILIQVGMLAPLAAGAGLLVQWVRRSERPATEG